MLTIPAGIAKNTHNASTFKPYDAAEAIGDTSPTAPKPGSKNKCGAFGAVLLLVVAIGVTLILPQVAPAVFKGFLGGIGAAMVGSAASQGFGLATGIQDKFSFKQVAMAGISAGVGGSLGGIAGGGFVGGAVGGIAGNAVTQGIAVATGLQKKFDWTGLAVAGVVGGAIGAMNGHFGNTAAARSLESYGQQLASGMAGAIAGGAARSLIDGSSFGDNVLAALPDVIGSTIGNMVGYGVASRGETSMARLRRAGGVEYAQNVDSNVRSDHDEIIITARRLKTGAAGFLERVSRGVSQFFQNFRQNDLVNRITMSISGASERRYAMDLSMARGRIDLGRQVVRGYQSLDRRYQVTTRVMGGVQAVGGGAEMLLGATMAGVGVAGTPVTAGASNIATVGGAIMFAAGADNMVAGARSVVNGRPSSTFGGRAISAATGMSSGGGELVYSVGQLGAGAAGALRVPGMTAGRTDAALSAGAVNPVHKNSLNYVGDTHVYVIRGPDGSLYKVGESAQGVRVSDGASIRAEQQARRLQRETGDFYTTEIRQGFDGKADARAYETRFIQTYERLYGKRPPGNPLDR